MSKSGRVALPDVRECTGDPAKCPGVVGGPTDVREASQMSRSVREAPLMFGSCWESLTDVREWSKDYVEFPGVVMRPF